MRPLRVPLAVPLALSVLLASTARAQKEFDPAQDGTAPATGYKVRVYSAAGSNVVLVRVLATENGKAVAAETRMRTNELTKGGAYWPAQIASDMGNSPIQGLHMKTFEVGVMDASGAVTRSQTMTATIEFDARGVSYRPRFRM